jgi:aerobic carbon-monoxide dehydrogenase small subunit
MNEIFVNGSKVKVLDKHLNVLLSHWLREELDLTGTKIGCGIGVCGSCTVLVDNVTVKSCKRRVSEFIGRNILTIEGMKKGDELHPLQQAFLDAGAIQCGFCTPGMVLTAHSFLLKNPKPSRQEVRKALTGNLCRCTGYQQIIDAVMNAARFYK